MVKKYQIGILIFVAFIFSAIPVFAQYAPPGGGGGYTPPGGGGTYFGSPTGSYNIYKTPQGTYSINVLDTEKLKDNVLIQNGELFIKLADGSYGKLSVIYVKNSKGELSATDDFALLPNTWRLIYTGGFTVNGYQTAPNGLTYIRNYTSGISPNEIGRYEVNGYFFAYEWLSNNGFLVTSHPDGLAGNYGVTMGELFSQYIKSSDLEITKKWMIPKKDISKEEVAQESKAKVEEQSPTEEKTIPVVNSVDLVKNFIKSFSKNLADKIFPNPEPPFKSFSPLASLNTGIGGNQIFWVNGVPIVTIKILSSVRYASDINLVTNDDKNFTLIYTKPNGKRIAVPLTQSEIEQLVSSPVKANKNPVTAVFMNAFQRQKMLPKSNKDLFEVGEALNRADVDSSVFNSRLISLRAPQRLGNAVPPRIKIDEIANVGFDSSGNPVVKITACRDKNTKIDIKTLSQLHNSC